MADAAAAAVEEAEEEEEEEEEAAVVAGDACAARARLRGRRPRSPFLCLLAPCVTAFVGPRFGPAGEAAALPPPRLVPGFLRFKRSARERQRESDGVRVRVRVWRRDSST